MEDMDVIIGAIIFILLASLWVLAILDAVRSNKIALLLVLIFIPLLGLILYFLIGRGQKVEKTE